MSIRGRASRVVYQNRWMTVREDDIERADGSTGVYGVVHKPDFVLVVPVDGDGFHLVEQDRYPVGGRYWEFPQGGWEDRPGADPLDVARGELREETGLRAGSLVRLGYLFEAYGYSDQGAHIFLATGLEKGPASPEASESDLRNGWFSRAEVASMIDHGLVRDAVSLAALTLLARHEEVPRAAARGPSPETSRR